MADTFTVKTMWNGKQRDIHVTNNGSSHVGNTDRTCVTSALLGHDFHGTSKATGSPGAGADSYIHCRATNTLYSLKKSAVTSDQDQAKKDNDRAVTITFSVLKIGSVNARVHTF